MGITYNTNIVRDGLVLHLDAANPKSYPGSGDTWYDLSGNGVNAEAIGSPVHVSGSHFRFDGIDDEFNSIDVSQEYRDLIVILNSTKVSGLGMVFGHYDNLDDSLRLEGPYLRITGNIDYNDWHYGSLSDVFIDGEFNALVSGNASLGNDWHFLRTYRSNTNGFGTSFRYEISSSFMDRRFMGNIALILAYDRKLSESEVQQNFEALRGRYGI